MCLRDRWSYRAQSQTAYFQFHCRIVFMLMALQTCRWGSTFFKMVSCYAMMYAQKILKVGLPWSERKILLLNVVKVEAFVFLAAPFWFSSDYVREALYFWVCLRFLLHPVFRAPCWSLKLDKSVYRQDSWNFEPDWIEILFRSRSASQLHSGKSFALSKRTWKIL